MKTAIWPGGPKLSNAPGVFPVGTDSVLLGDFARRPGKRHLLDLGCGGGLLMLLLCFENPALEALGVDISPAAIALAADNFQANGLEGRCRAVLGDLRAPRGLIPPAAFDLAVANPPYFPTGDDPARAETDCSLAQLCAAAAYGLQNGGDFALVHRPERLPTLFAAMSAAGLEPKRLRFVFPSPSAAPCLVLAEGRKGAKPGLHCLPPLLLNGPDGGPSEELRHIYKGG